jgi:hypothetical protein
MRKQVIWLCAIAAIAAESLSLPLLSMAQAQAKWQTPTQGSTNQADETVIERSVNRRVATTSTSG